VDAARAAADTATLLIAEVNSRMPRTRGNVVVPVNRLGAFIANDPPMHEHNPGHAPAIGRAFEGEVEVRRAHALGAATGCGRDGGGGDGRGDERRGGPVHVHPGV